MRELTVDFGGLRAVDGFSLTAAADTITGLIGPNGAGKTTTFNACTGFVRPTKGEILFRGEPIERLTAPQRAQRGMGRTFQQVQLYEALSVYQNVLLGADAVLAGSRVLGTVASRRGEGERAWSGPPRRSRCAALKPYRSDGGVAFDRSSTARGGGTLSRRQLRIPSSRRAIGRIGPRRPPIWRRFCDT